MSTEYEVKFLAIDVDGLRGKLKSLGAELKTPMRLMRRVVIETPELHKKDAFVRVRDEGDKVTVTYKEFGNRTSVDGAKELEVAVSDFEEMSKIFDALDLNINRKSYQESRRETWKLEGAEVVIDEWPWIKPYVEVEGEDEEHVRAVSEKLGFEWSQASFGDVMAAYRAEYPHLTNTDTVGSIESVKFDEPMPQMLKN
jgi:adenylate cyclase, class 2